jgi:phage terminase large subunit-like protein
LADLAARVLGVELMPWQLLTLGDQLGLGSDGRPVFRQSVVSVARQNGKSTALKALVLYWLIEMPRIRGQQQTVLTTAHRLDLAAELFNQLAPLLESQFQAKVIYSYGRQSVELPAVGDYPGARWLVRAATPSAGHGLSCDLVVVDELWGCSADSVEGGLIPTMRARRDPLLSCWSTAGTESESDVFKRLRERAMGEIDMGIRSRLYFCEYSPPSNIDPLSLEAAIWANPARGFMLEDETIVEELKQPNKEEVLRTVCNLWVQSHRAWLDAGMFESLRADIELPAEGGVLAIEASSHDDRFVGVRAVEVGDKVHVTVEFIVSTLADLWQSVRESQKAHKGQTLAIGASLDVHLSPELKGRAVLVGMRELQKWTVIVRSMVTSGQVLHTGEQLLIEQVSRAVAVKHQGHLSLSSARSPGDISLCRAFVWAVAQAGKPKTQTRAAYAFAD